MMETIVAGIIVLVVTALAAFGIGRVKGKAKGEKVAEQAHKETQAAKREAAGERAKAEAAQQRREIDDEVQALPAESAGDELSAADRLRRDWSRD